MICQRCDDTGYEPIFSEDRVEWPTMQLCKCDAGRRLRYWGVPSGMRDWTFETFPASLGTVISVNKHPIGVDGVRIAFTERDKWLILCGPVGTGKTSLAVSGYKLLRDRGVAGRFWNMAQLFDATKKSFGDPDRVDPMEKLYNAPAVLVLDGLGERNLTDWERGAVNQLLGQRYAFRLRTIVTTNWQAGEFGRLLGDWIGDRLNEIAIVMNVAGASMRGRA